METTEELKNKSRAKQSALRNADLNFISTYSLETICDALLEKSDQQTEIKVVTIDEDTALFSMTGYLDGRTSAFVQGRLRRWAGDMTHIYCDARSFEQRNWAFILFRNALGLFFAAPIIFAILSILIGTPTWLGLLLGWSLVLAIFTFMSGGIFAIFYLLIRFLMVSPTSEQAVSKPAAKERERLLHILTSIITDYQAMPETANLKQADINPLSDDEIRVLIEQASLDFKHNH